MANLDGRRMGRCIRTGGYLPTEQLHKGLLDRDLEFKGTGMYKNILYTSTLCSRINCLRRERRSVVSTVPMSTV